MSTLVSRLKRWFRGRNKPAIELVTNPFPPIDRAALRTELSLVATAKADGFENQPQADSESPSELEQAIRHRYERRQALYRSRFTKQAEAHLARAKQVRDTLDVAGTADIDRDAVSNMIAIAKEREGPLDQRASKLNSRAAELRTFRTQNDLLDRVPQSSDPNRVVVVFLAVLLFELIVTAFLLRESGGLPMVVIISSVYCLLNCVPPFFGSDIVRWINLRRPRTLQRKVIGWFLIPILLLAGLTINLLVGHYRSEALKLAEASYTGFDLQALQEMANRVNQISGTAWRAFIESPLGIDDTWSWLLAAAGLLAFVVSFREGFLRCDAYPGYTDVVQSYETEREKYDAEVTALMAELGRTREEGKQAVRQEKQRLLGHLEGSRDPEWWLQDLRDKYASAMRLLNDDFRALIEEYRKINKSMRNDALPQHFSETPTLEETNAPRIDIPPIRHPERRQVLENLASADRRLSGEYDRLVAGLRSSKAVITGRDPLESEGSS